MRDSHGSGPGGPCERVRQQLSASRDGDESADHRWVEAHASACAGCRAWLRDLDRLTARQRVAVVRSPDLVGRALAEWDRQAAGAADRGRATPGWRAALAVAGVASVVVGASRLLAGAAPWLEELAHAHHLREAAAVELALGIGFVFGAWRPGRFTAGLVPVAWVAVGLLVTVTAVDTLAGRTNLLAEAVHLPLALGALALVVVQRRSGRGRGPSSRWAPLSSEPDPGIAA